MAYTFKPLPTGKVDILENGVSAAQGGPGFDVAYAKTLGYDPNPVSQPGVISPESLGHTTPVPVVDPKPVMTYDISGLEATPPEVATPQETKISEQSSRLGKLYESLVGKSADQTAEEAKQGIPEMQKMQSELSIRLKSLQNEALAIPQRAQLGAEGRGITEGGLAPIQAAATRQNAIEALTVKTLFEASQGNLSYAQSLADRAVAQKYDPIQAEIEAATANLKLLQNDPKTTLQEKNRAQLQLDIQKKREEDLAKEKAEATDVWNVTTTAASNGQNFVANGSFKSLSQTLDAVSKAKTKEEALAIASSTGLLGDPATTKLQVLGNSTSGYFTYNPTTGETKPLRGGSGGGGGGGSTPVPGPVTGTQPAPVSNYKFTDTQINSGAASAATTKDAFKKLPGEVQNFYVNSKKLVEQFNVAKSSVNTGDATRAQVTANIQAMNLPQSVKDYLVKQLPPDWKATTAPSGGSLLSNVWNNVKTFFSNPFGTTKPLNQR